MQVGVVHLGFGAFHRAHQAVYLDDYMDCPAISAGVIAAVNLRGSEAIILPMRRQISNARRLLSEIYSFDGQVALRRVRAHVHFMIGA